MRIALLVCLVSATAAAEVRTVPAFHALELSSVLDVEVSLGPTAKVELTGPKDWVARTKTEVAKDGTLVVSLPGKWRDVEKVKLSIVMPSLTAIHASGVVDLAAAKLTGKALDVDLSGVGTLVLSGAVDKLRVTASGAGDVKAKDLTAAAVEAKLSGAGSVAVRATKQIDADLSGVGDLDIYGNPASVKQNVSGVGDIHLR